MLASLYQIVGYIVLGLIACYLLLALLLPLLLPHGVALGLVHTGCGPAPSAAHTPRPQAAMVDLASMEQVLIRSKDAGVDEIKLLIDRRLLGSPRLLIFAPSKHFTIVPIRRSRSPHAPLYG